MTILLKTPVNKYIMSIIFITIYSTMKPLKIQRIPRIS